jgi:hypothetical protein
VKSLFAEASLKTVEVRTEKVLWLAVELELESAGFPQSFLTIKVDVGDGKTSFNEN